MDRRDFFGVIAAPLVRRLVPPVPMASKPRVSGIPVCMPAKGELLNLSDYVIEGNKITFSPSVITVRAASSAAGSGSFATGKLSHWVVTAARSFRPA